MRDILKMALWRGPLLRAVVVVHGHMCTCTYTEGDGRLVPCGDVSKLNPLLKD